MLVLTRKVGEKILVGSDIVVRVVEIRGDKVRIGIDAPDDVAVWREELWMKAVSQRFLVVLEDEPAEAMA